MWRPALEVTSLQCYCRGPAGKVPRHWQARSVPRWRGGRITRADGGSMGQVTLSIGIAVAEEGESLERLMQRADTALYGAKRAGRNRVELANGGPAYDQMPPTAQKDWHGFVCLNGRIFIICARGPQS